MMKGLQYSAVGRAMKFGYANARVKSMKQTLLSEREISAFLDAKDNVEIFALLERTPYRQDLVASSLNHMTVADKIELAATKNFSRTLRTIRKIIPKEFKEKVSQMFERYDIENIKTILAAKHMNESKEKIAPYITETGAGKAGLFTRLLEARTVKDVVTELGGTPYGKALQAKLREFENSKDIAVLLSALDEYYYSRAPEIAKNPYGDERIIAEMLRAQVDAKNISNILRAKKATISHEKIEGMIIANGNITRDKLMAAAGTKSVDEAIKMFEQDYPLGKAAENYKKNGSLIGVELELEKGTAKRGLKTLRNSVLSIGAIAGFLLLKEEEISNIRKIVRAKEFGLSAEKVREMIVSY